MGESIERVFLESVLGDPDSDAPRLIYADWLEDRGGPGDAGRAEFIRAQCALARLAPSDPARQALAARAEQLLRAHGPAWAGEHAALFESGCLHFERGFPARAALTFAELRELGEQLFAEAPIQELSLSGVSSEADAAAAALGAPLLRRLRALTIRFEVFYAELAMGRLLASLSLPRLRELALRWSPPVPSLVRALPGPAQLPGLRALDLREAGLGDEGACALAAAPLLERLTTLRLDHNGIGPDGARALLARANLPALTHLSLDGCPIGPEGARALAARPQLFSGAGELRLNHARIGDEGLKALAASPGLARLSALHLRGNGAGDAGARALAGSPHAAGLTFLDLGKNRIRDAGAAALAGSPHLADLTALLLRHNEVRQPGALALAHSPYLGRIVTLTLGSNAPGAEGERALRQRFGVAFKL
jgi:uncharacterized protein (TIGR02996 family)